MNAIYSIAVCCGLTSGQGFTCPENEGVCVVGTYPDPESCAHYYHCSPGVLLECIQVKYQCPELFAFDRLIQQCVLAVDAECNGMDS